MSKYEAPISVTTNAPSDSQYAPTGRKRVSIGVAASIAHRPTVRTPRSGPTPYTMPNVPRKTQAEKNPTAECGSQRAQPRIFCGSQGTQRATLASSSGGIGRKAKAPTNRSWRNRCRAPRAIRASERRVPCVWVVSFTGQR